MLVLTYSLAYPSLRLCPYQTLPLNHTRTRRRPMAALEFGLPSSLLLSADTSGSAPDSLSQSASQDAFLPNGLLSGEATLLSETAEGESTLVGSGGFGGAYPIHGDLPSLNTRYNMHTALSSTPCPNHAFRRAEVSLMDYISASNWTPLNVEFGCRCTSIICGIHGGRFARNDMPVSVTGYVRFVLSSPPSAMNARPR